MGSQVDAGIREGVLLELGREVLVGLVDRVRGEEEVQIARADRAELHEGVEVDHLLPEALPEQHDRHVLLDLARLDEGEDLHELVQGPEAAGHDHHGLGQVAEPELPHEEVVELDREPAGDVGVVVLLERERDVQADVLALGIAGTTIGGLHDPRTPAGADHEPPIRALEALRPLGEAPGQLLGLLVVVGVIEELAGALDVAALGLGLRDHLLRLLLRAQPGAAEDHDRVLDPELLEAGLGLHVLREDAQRARIGRVEELLVLVRLHGAVAALAHGAHGTTPAGVRAIGLPRVRGGSRDQAQPRSSSQSMARLQAPSMVSSRRANGVQRRRGSGTIPTRRRSRRSASQQAMTSGSASWRRPLWWRQA